VDVPDAELNPIDHPELFRDPEPPDRYRYYWRPCSVCGKHFADWDHRPDRVAASCEDCPRVDRRSGLVRRVPTKHPMGLNTSVTGAIGEMKVGADLMHRGYYVYRCLSPTGPCDLIAMDGGRLWRVEVKMAYRGAEGGITPPTIRRPKSFDVLACVLPDGSIVYEPDLPSVMVDGEMTEQGWQNRGGRPDGTSR